MVLIFLLILILIFECFYYIYIINSRKQNKIEYFRDIPSNENPALVGMMVKGNVDGNDLMATVLDLWEKGYVNLEYQMINGNEQCIISDSGKDRFLTLKDYENYLLDEMFKENSKIIFENFVNSPKFEIVFKNIGNMISKRVDIKSNHKISKSRLINKINFIVNYIVFGTTFVFPFIYHLLNNFNLTLIIGYLISLMLFIMMKLLVTNKNEVEHIIMSYSLTISIVCFGILFSIFLIADYNYEYNFYINIFNMIMSILFIFSFMLGDYDKKVSFNFIDLLVLIYSIVSTILFDLIGICLCSLYFSHRIYIKSQNHVYIKNANELEKWLALKKFLNEFTIINERNVEEIKIWDKYLIYAIAMGVNKKIISEYIKLTNIRLINKNILDKYYVENIGY